MALPRDIEQVLAKMEKAIADEFRSAFTRMTSQAQITSIAGHIASGNVDAAITALRIDPVFFQPLDRAIQEAFFQGGVQALAGLPPIADPFGGGSYAFGFDGRHPRAEMWVRESSSNLITEIVTEQRDMARSVIESGIRQGINPRTTALDIVGRIDPISKIRSGGILGLTSGQERASQRALEELRSGSTADLNSYLRRGRRDKRYDSVVRRAIRDGTPIPESTISKATQSYRNRLLKYRGDVIARTEGINALRAGRHEGYAQLLDTGLIKEKNIVRVWDATMDSKTRPDHATMDGTKVKGMTEPFVMPDGSRMMYPGDSSLGAPGEQIIQCRCFETVRIDYLADIDDPIL